MKFSYVRPINYEKDFEKLKGYSFYRKSRQD